MSWSVLSSVKYIWTDWNEVQGQIDNLVVLKKYEIPPLWYASLVIIEKECQILHPSKCIRNCTSRVVAVLRYG